VDLLVPDGTSLGHRAPLFAVPYLDSIMLDVLAIVQPLHRQDAVERDLLWKIHFNRCVVGSGRRGPERIRIPIEGCCRPWGRSAMLLRHQILTIAVAERGPQLFQSPHVYIG